MSSLTVSLRTEARWAIADALVVCKRNLYRYMRSPELLVFSTIQPVIFVLLFVYVFGGAIQTGDISYVTFLIPGVIVQTAVFGSAATGIGLAEDVAGGMVDRFRSLPMARSAVLAGRILADTLRNVFVVCVMIAVGYTVGFRFSNGIGMALLVPVVAVAFGHAFCWIQAFIGVSVRDAETAQVAGFIWMFPFTFISSAFVPVESMPAWLQVVADANPVTITVNTLRAMTLGGDVWGYLWKAMVWALAIIAVFGPLAVSRYRRVS